ncbi:MAG: hypothetical protein ABI895_02190 [Deltaproteobacteria bacterium]
MDDERSGVVALPAILPSRQMVGFSTRLGALATLGVIAFGVCYGVYSVYTAARDAFVVPIIMSPSSEAVLATKLRLGELRVERVRAVGDLEGVEADLAGADQGLARLLELKRTTGEGRHWTTHMTSQKARENTAELSALSSQKQVLANMFASQQRLTARAQKDFEAGLISRSEYAHQEQALNEMRLQMLDNGRATVRGESALEETHFAQAALARTDAPPTPELVNRQEQLIRVDLEIVRLDSERRAKAAVRDALAERIAQIDEMVEQIEERPLFQALDKDLELAFVPYTQLPGMTAGAEVYDCLWGVAFCSSVGTVAARVPGEVVQPDSWGSATRGEYVVLDLKDHGAAHAKTLRIRAWQASDQRAPDQQAPDHEAPDHEAASGSPAASPRSLPATEKSSRLDR